MGALIQKYMIMYRIDCQVSSRCDIVAMVVEIDQVRRLARAYKVVLPCVVQRCMCLDTNIYPQLYGTNQGVQRQPTLPVQESKAH